MGVDISVIVPVYNSEKYIGKCIESVLEQSHKNIELILVDDASTDASLRIMNNYAKDYSGLISIIIQERNSKQGAARNRGVKEAKGKYILFLDSDDMLDRNACGDMYTEAEKWNADIVFCDYQCFGQGIEEYCSHVSLPYMGYLDVNKKKALLTTSVVPWAKIIKKSLITDNDIYFPEGKFYEDQATTYLYYLYAGCVSKVEKALYRYRLTGESTSTEKNNTRHFQSLEMAKLLINRLKERGFYDTYQQEIEYFAIEQMYCLSIERANLQFDEFPINYADKLMEALRTEFPDFLNNVYYKFFMSERRSRIIQMHLESKEALIEYIKADKKDFCPNYTSKLKEHVIKLCRLKEKIINRNFDIALWGAGKFGIKLLRVLQEYNINVKKIYDGDLKLVNEMYDIFSVSDYRDIEKDALIIVPFENWMPLIKQRLKSNCIHANLLNFEVFIKHNIDNCIEEV